MSDDRLQGRIKAWRLGSLLVAILAGVACAWVWVQSEDALLRSYLLGFLFWCSVSLGCLGTLLIYYLTGGRWGREAQPLLESGAATLPLVALAFVPIALEVQRYYPWAIVASHVEIASHATVMSHAEVASVDPDVAVVHHSPHIAADVLRYYLNPLAFRLRAVGYFVVWLVLMAIFCRSRGPIQRPPRIRRLAAGGAVALVFTTTFAAIDWAMSLEAGWFSTMYGALFAMGALLAGLALTTTILALANYDSRSLAAAPDTLADLATILQAFLMLWAYFAFSQFLIVWMGNLPEENVWYLRRSAGGWKWLTVNIVVLQFALPFLLLLSRDIKLRPGRLAAVAAIVFAMQFVYLGWTILPVWYPTVADLRPGDLAAPAAIGGVWLAYYFTKLLGKAPVSSEAAI